MAITECEFLKIERRGRVLLVTLNRPDKLNAIDGRVHDELVRLFHEAEWDPDCDVIVITGAGRAFCSGGDISHMDSEQGSDIVRRDSEVHFDAGRRFIHAILEVEKPIIAMVNGPVVGLGATLALFCDIVIASTTATIADTHVNVGLVAGDGGTVIWPMLVGINKAKELLMTGRSLTPEQAERLGIYNHVLEPDELVDYTMKLADELAALPPFAVKATKASINRQLRHQVENVLDVSLAYEAMSMRREDHREAARAFINRKRVKD